MPEAVFRYDVSSAIGFGHAVRCSALAGHLGALGWHTTAAMKGDAAAQHPWLQGFDRTIMLEATDEDEPAALRAAAGKPCDLLIVDHYGWDARRERACRGWAETIAVIDDLAERDHDCDLLCDSSLDRQPQDYAARVPANATLLLEPRYALLRPGFAAARHRLQRGRDSGVRRLFVNVGATDPSGLLPKIVDGIALAGFDGAVDIVVASQAHGLTALMRKLETAGFVGLLHVDAANVPGLMAEANLAIGAAGGTAWERCCLGLPGLVIVAAENQRHLARGLAAAGAARVLKSDFSAQDLAALLAPLLRDDETRAGMARNASRLCDGLGCGRMAQALLYPASAVTLRPVDVDDQDILLQWQREPRMRCFAREPQVPSLSEHAAWFAAKRDDLACVFHLIEVDRVPAGFLRLDFRPETGSYEVSIAVTEAFHGRGVARAALAIVRRLLPWAEFRAWVRSENTASLDLFRKSGYDECRRGQEGEGIWLASMPLTAPQSRPAELRCGVTK